MTTMYLGLAVSNDALHYREPIPNFPVVSAAEDGWELPPYGDQFLNFPALIQGKDLRIWVRTRLGRLIYECEFDIRKPVIPAKAGI